VLHVARGDEYFTDEELAAVEGGFLAGGIGRADLSLPPAAATGSPNAARRASTNPRSSFLAPG